MLSPTTCTICHSPSSQQYPVSNCRRCKRESCSKCCSSIQIYQKIGTKVQLSTATVCEGCRSQQMQLKMFKQTNKLRFATSSAIGHRLLKFISQSSSQSLAAEYKQAQTIRRARENEQIYQRLRTKINEQKMCNRTNLSQSLLQLYSMVTVDIREQEQHERIRNLLMALVLNKPISCIENIAQMVMFFLLFLNEQETYHIVARLYKNYLPSFIYLNRTQQIQELKSQFEERLNQEKINDLPYGTPQAYLQCWKTLTINKLNPELSFMVLQQLFGHKNQLEEYFDTIMIKLIKQCGKSGSADDNAFLKLQRVPPFGIKTSSTRSTTSKQSASTNGLSDFQQFSPMKSQSTIPNSSQNNILRKVVQKLVIQQDDILNDMRNQYYLIIQMLKKQQQQFQKQQQKHEKQKDDLIQKIVKLNNRIYDNEISIQSLKKQKQESETKYQNEIRLLEDKIQELLQNTSGQQSSEFSNIISRSQRKKVLNELAEQIDIQIKLPAMLTLEDTLEGQKILIENINSKITQLNTQIQTLTISVSDFKRVVATNQQKNKSQLQTRKLLDIISKKEQRFVLQIVQKDRIIQCYENILWHLENNITEFPKKNELAPRIYRIMQFYQEKKKSKQVKQKGKQQRECLLF